MHNDTQSRVNAIREWLAQHNIDALLVPHEDEYLGEYVPAHNERLHWLTGFTGSAGAAVITKDKAAIFVDGRYTVQVTKQVPADLFEYRHLIEEPALDWIKDHLTNGASVAIDPRMHNSAWLDMAQAKLAGALELKILDSNQLMSYGMIDQLLWFLMFASWQQKRLVNQVKVSAKKSQSS